MMTRRTTTLALAGFMLLCVPLAARAYTSIMNDWQGYYDVCAPLVAEDCAACHQNGFDYNPYGADLKTRINDLNMERIEAFVDAENVDSDGDGYKNGQEIVIDCTLPGDATSHGTVDANAVNWSSIKALYR